MYRLVLLRHGESLWNNLNLFTGWYDSDLSDVGREQAFNAGKKIRQSGITCDIVLTSVLSRAIRTAWLALDGMGNITLPVYHHWHLNERHYGALQGMNKDEARQQFGKDQVHLWRRSYRAAPPPLADNDLRHPKWDQRYKSIAAQDLPGTESLADTYKRTIPFFQCQIAPLLRLNKTVMISAHGNSLRTITKYLLNISDQQISNVNIPNAAPIMYELDENLNFYRKYEL
ncbi:2,3-diphosphoglycerate-dependent phosphoglycerate mutase [Candidatus Ichthyocystis hellenicum]|uniref:2,3-bisphosphoglycerate-dependent phosphoglycerate mutase n=1 Tax=Candidatus Ichthyocystis hellenicum TaxID=1561003 RepID=A0A0S4LZZ9_9BURK|nr:2,3-diphosphoglycerate-dependent phosphoglycerate mutase [Candidatus Ichthyocystis hellenicum]CUT17145.1 2,3-bisphosphoglycerate-dependent phosphoglycerate mutase [Candidatus Ichthyocystis hellenicum]